MRWAGEDAPRWRVPAQRAVAVLGTLLVGARIDLLQGVTLGLLLALALTPVWWRPAWSLVGYRWLTATSGIAVVAGFWLTRLAAADHTTNTTIAVRNSVLVIGLPVLVGFLIWACRQVPPPLLAVCFGVAMLVTVRSGGAFASNPWKFGFATPVTIVVLGLAWWSGRRAVQVAGALLISAVHALNDARSAFAILFLVAVVMLWEGRPTTGTRRSSGLRAGALVAGLGTGAYWLVQALILDGAFGEATQVRTQAQIAQSGSVLLGGRPEIGAFRALLAHRPIGFGSGTTLTSEEILVAKEGMAAVGYEPNNGYVENYMFGGQIELHSGVGDLWAWAGAAGLLLAVVLVVLVGAHTARGIAACTSVALGLALGFRFLWDMLFSPLVSSTTNLVLLLGLGFGAWWVGDGPRRPQSRAEPVGANSQA
ncbi:hypothetical protein [Cellulomonas shaoxiangyii]|uniref:O-antigen ligase domain-containing protein n=1 Tax=Cellulomonas shaoxiangyii TaxID=2566013 RepID=A0A4P7SKN0_9CELL|nr:hypothetical protein [Cellulomonas shaoxiangyii]QCB94431.1 hypothetical protein E5225_13575 [Cellulomonas shaoxiangyii]TGY85164.1 hypothetical protein E5226_07985 [Cellulomonas shaoxiangyii]